MSTRVVLLDPGVVDVDDVPFVVHARGERPKVSLWLGHQSLKTTEMYLRTDPAEKPDMLSEWHFPSLGKGRFTGVKDVLMAMLSNV